MQIISSNALSWYIDIYKRCIQVRIVIWHRRTWLVFLSYPHSASPLNGWVIQWYSSNHHHRLPPAVNKIGHESSFIPSSNFSYVSWKKNTIQILIWYMCFCSCRNWRLLIYQSKYWYLSSGPWCYVLTEELMKRVASYSCWKKHHLLEDQWLAEAVNCYLCPHISALQLFREVAVNSWLQLTHPTV